jgi:hypothetical protein
MKLGMALTLFQSSFGWNLNTQPSNRESNLLTTRPDFRHFNAKLNELKAFTITLGSSYPYYQNLSVDGESCDGGPGNGTYTYKYYTHYQYSGWLTYLYFKTMDKWIGTVSESVHKVNHVKGVPVTVLVWIPSGATVYLYVFFGEFWW